MPISSAFLDDGLPGGASAEVAFAATDRNWGELGPGRELQSLGTHPHPFRVRRRDRLLRHGDAAHAECRIRPSRRRNAAAVRTCRNMKRSSRRRILQSGSAATIPCGTPAIVPLAPARRRQARPRAFPVPCAIEPARPFQIRSHQHDFESPL